MPRSARLTIAALSLTVFLGACGGDAGESDTAPPEATSEPAAAAELIQPPAPPGAMVRIVSPAEGEVVQGPRITVRLEAAGVPIVPATDTTTGTGHHHVFLDDDVSAPGEVIPTITNRVVHMGTGVSEVVLDEVAPGEHRLIAVVADWRHIPLVPWVVDTIHFTVR